MEKVVDVIKEKCANCHACISSCPVKMCNKASGEYVEINHEACIGCGKCIEVCEKAGHKARIAVDDAENFIKDLSWGVQFYTIVAPAIYSNFKDYRKVNYFCGSVVASLASKVLIFSSA